MLAYVVLVLTALFSSIISGTMGMGGGIILFAVMANFLPPMVLIPVHGAVQFASNTTRALLHTKDIVWRVVVPFALGGAPAAYLASQIVVDIPESAFKIFIGIFIIVLTWMPKLKRAPKIRGKFFVLGFVATFISLFVGATGPFIAPFYLREGLVKEKLVATKATCQLFLHFFKIAAFLNIGFNFQAHSGLLIGLIVAVIIGNTLGKYILKKISDNSFIVALKILLTMLAVLMIARAIFHF